MNAHGSNTHRQRVLPFALLIATVGSLAIADVSEVMRAAIPGARSVARYTAVELIQLLRKRGLSATLGTPIDLTPNAPLSANGASLSFWKPAYVMGSAEGGEAGINFWSLFSGGHVNVAFSPSPATSTLLDCRLLSAGRIRYKIFSGVGQSPNSEGVVELAEGHALLVIPMRMTQDAVSVELWPEPINTPVGFLGCGLWPVQ